MESHLFFVGQQCKVVSAIGFDTYHGAPADAAKPRYGVASFCIRKLDFIRGAAELFR